MTNREPLAVIFDVDGVLIDSYGPHFESWRRVARERGIDYTESMFARGFGRTSREIIAGDWELPDVTAEEIAALDEEKEATFREIVADDYPAMPGATELTRRLWEEGFAVAVGSSGPAKNVALAIERLEIGSYLSAWVTGDDVTRGKPDPQIFLRAAEKLGVAPERCVVVEDAPAGIEAAQRAKMVCVGFASTGRTLDDVREAELVIGELAEISPEVLRGLIERGRC